MNVNKVILVGRLTRDPDVRSTQSGQTVVNVSLATSRMFTDKNGQKQEQKEFHNLVLWGRLGEIAGQYLIKGQQCCFEGRLQTRSYIGKDSVERKITEVVVENMQMGSKPQNTTNTYRNTPSQNTNIGTSQQNKVQSQNKEEDIPTIHLDDEKDDVRLEDVPF